MRYLLNLMLLFLCTYHLSFSGGMYKSYLVKVKSKSRPFSPGDQRSNIARIKDQGNDSLSSLEALLLKELSQVNLNLNGPRRASSPKVKKIQKLWFINTIRVICRFDFLDKIKSQKDVIEVIPDELVYLSFENNDDESEISFLQNSGLSDLHDQKITGKGVRIGVIDTGILNHEAFKNKILIYKNFTKSKIEGQVDPIGHGSHVSAILVGEKMNDRQIGVAPDSKLIVARAIERVSNLGSQALVKKRVQAFASKILEAMQWMLDPDQNPDTDDFPKIINNSWGFTESMPLSKGFFDSAIAKWRELGIIPVFAAGNMGREGENSILFPSNSYEVITVGALKGASLAKFSSIGSDALKKPDFVMQGYRVYSLMRKRSGEVAYGYQSGTSMASPKLSALIALMYQVDPFLNYDEVYSLLKESSQDLGEDGFDKKYGWGYPDMKLVIENVKINLIEKTNSGTKSTFKYYSHYSSQEEKTKEIKENIINLEKSYENFIKQILADHRMFLLNSWEVELNKEAKKFPKLYQKLKAKVHRIKKFSSIFTGEN
ncbi:MAG: hypothetical protein COB02_00215 [Candidatus Cloacimonadota bacterium]|nr:MAG: hypothetical protein COB02_04350 [Candidatus Cloacimonadota bacterium]PCJ21047.1 MAG: hypothetical protein COB02_00215 [Candidatus Cloacimonadota bacterium]